MSVGRPDPEAPRGRRVVDWLVAVPVLVGLRLVTPVFGHGPEESHSRKEGTTMVRNAVETEPRSRGAIDITGKYLSLTTYRRDGSPVSTPVWFVRDGDRLVVTTAADSYKAKRLRRSPAAMVAPCNARGVPKREPVPAQVEFLASSEHARIDRLMQEKYRVDRILILPLYRLVTRLRGAGSATDDTVYLAITPR